MYEIRFLPENRVERFAGSRGNYYEFADGRHLDMETRPVWCRPCAAVRHGENLPTVQKAEADLASAPHPRPDPVFVVGPGGPLRFGSEADCTRYVDRWRKEAELRLRWRTERSSPPRCIRCGSAEIVLLPCCVPIPHPEGEGTLELRWVGMCSTRFNEWFFTPEGDRIPRNTKPTYWHHPAMDDDINKARRGRMSGADRPTQE